MFKIKFIAYDGLRVAECITWKNPHQLLDYIGRYFTKVLGAEDVSTKLFTRLELLDIVDFMKADLEKTITFTSTRPPEYLEFAPNRNLLQQCINDIIDIMYEQKNGTFEFIHIPEWIKNPNY